MCSERKAAMLFKPCGHMVACESELKTTLVYSIIILVLGILDFQCWEFCLVNSTNLFSFFLFSLLRSYEKVRAMSGTD